MLAEYKKKTNIAIGLAIVAFLVGCLLSGAIEEDVPALQGVFGLAVIPLFIYGCCCYAKGKGYHGAWGLLGVFCPFGLIILVCFPDRHKTTKKTSATPIAPQNTSEEEQL